MLHWSATEQSSQQSDDASHSAVAVAVVAAELQLQYLPAALCVLAAVYAIEKA
jgi:hypothetical protein